MKTLLALTSVVLACCTSPSKADDWPQWLGPRRDGVWRETGILKVFPATGPKVRWRLPIGSGYAGPAVAGGKVFVVDRQLDAGQANPGSGFGKAVIAGMERVLCLDEATGTILWQHAYPAKYSGIGYPSGPRATPTVDGNRVYTLGAMGDLLCLDIATGKVLWAKNFPSDYEAGLANWGFAASPLIDGDRLICLVGGNLGTVAAFDKNDGKVVWQALKTSGQVGYCPPMIYETGGCRQLIIWSPEGVASLDPVKGNVYWSEPWKLHQSAMSISTPRFTNGKLFLTSFYNGSMMLELDPAKPTEKVVWKGKWWKGGNGAEQSNKSEGLHSIMSTPILTEDHIYGVCSYGQLRCLQNTDGKRLWETFAATSGEEVRWGNAFLVSHEDRAFLYSEKGDLIIARLKPTGYEELSRANLLKPDNIMAGRLVVWSHPAFANKSVYARNDKEIICVSLAAE